MLGRPASKLSGSEVPEEQGQARGRPHQSSLDSRAQARLSSLFLGSRLGRGPAPRPQPLRPFQQRMDDSSDVWEAPARGPLLFQDVVGLAQGLLGGGAQVKFPLSPPPVSCRLGDTQRESGQRGLIRCRGQRSGAPWTWLGDNEMQGSCQQITEGRQHRGPTLRGKERPVISRGKCWSRQAGTRSPRAQ